METNNGILSQENRFSGVSKRYTHVKTEDIIKAFTDKGYVIRDVQVSRTRKKEHEGFQKHLVRLTHPDFTLKTVGDSKPEILVRNSYDGESSGRLYLGVYRLVCSNGLIVGKTFDEIRVRHSGDALTKFLEGAEKIRKQADSLNETIASWSNIKLTPIQVSRFSFNAWDIIAPKNAFGPDLGVAFAPSREADIGLDLWRTYNRIQERLLNGGIHYQINNDDGEIRNNTTKRVKGVDSIIRINQKLFDLAVQVSHE